MDKSILQIEVQSASRVLVIGSCMSHDFARNLWNGATNTKYLWRISTPSLMSTPVDLNFLIDTSVMNETDRLTFERDVYKDYSLLDLLEWCDVVILDNIRDTYDFLQITSDTYITRGVEIEKYGLEARFGVSELYRFGTKQHMELWDLMHLKLMEALNSSGKPVLLLKSCFSLVYYRNYEFKLIEDFPAINILKRSIISEHLDAVTAGRLDYRIFLQFPSFMQFADPEHPWGRNPAHFSRESIGYLTENLRFACEEGTLFRNNSKYRSYYRERSESQRHLLLGMLTDEDFAPPPN